MSVKNFGVYIVVVETWYRYKENEIGHYMQLVYYCQWVNIKNLLNE